LVRDAAYTLTLFGPSGNTVATKSGLINLPPGSTAPLFIPGVYFGSKQISQAFLTFDPASLTYFRSSSKPIWPTPSHIQITNGPMPRVTATITNPTAHPIYNETVVVTVFDNSQPAPNAVGASQTVVPILPAQGTASLVFTWNQPFVSPGVSAEILPATGS
jgi:hypothetical protein